MGNSASYISTSDSTSSSGSSHASTSTFEMIRQMSYESDVFYSDTNGRQSTDRVAFEATALPEIVPERFPAWRIDDLNPVLLKYMQRSYNPCSEDLKTSAKKLAELVAAQKVPKFVSTFGGSQCIKLHWACLAGWCMCRYQYQPLTPLHLMPHTRLTTCNAKSSVSLPSSSLSSEKSDDHDTLKVTEDRYSEHQHDQYNVHEALSLDVITRESTV